ASRRRDVNVYVNVYIVRFSLAIVMLRYSRTGRDRRGLRRTRTCRSRGRSCSASEREVGAEIEAASRSVLRRADADAGAVAEEIDAIGHVDERDADIEILVVRERELPVD